MARKRGRPQGSVTLVTGPEGMVMRMFELAWRDLRKGGRLAADAERFLLDPVTVENVTVLGADADRYVSRVTDVKRET